MSLFQCQRCGCRENTALSSQGFGVWADRFDWAGIEDRKGLLLCSACGPTKYSDGSPTNYGQWHGVFQRVFLPLGMFRTAQNGNLEHVETGEQDVRKYALPDGAASCGGTEQCAAICDEHPGCAERTRGVAGTSPESCYARWERWNDAGMARLYKPAHGGYPTVTCGVRALKGKTNNGKTPM